MDLAGIIAGIEKPRARFELVPDVDLQDWAFEAIEVFNEPPAEAVKYPERGVEIIARILANNLRRIQKDRLAPSVPRIAGAFHAVLPMADDNMRRQLAMWAEVIAFYLREK